MKHREVEHARGKLGRGEFALAGERGDGLVVEQAVGQAVEPRRLYPALLAVKLDECDSLEQLPGNGLGK